MKPALPAVLLCYPKSFDTDISTNLFILLLSLGQGFPTVMYVITLVAPSTRFAKVSPFFLNVSTALMFPVNTGKGTSHKHLKANKCTLSWCVSI
jgi:hypothetical protein